MTQLPSSWKSLALGIVITVSRVLRPGIMEDLLKKIPPFAQSPKQSKSSKKFNSSNSRSSTPPPPLLSAPLSPLLDIPAPLSVGLPSVPDKLHVLPHPPFVTADDPPTTPLHPLPPVLTQTAVTQRDYASRVFEPSPLSKELPSPTTPAEQEQIERQRGRYHFRRERCTPRMFPPRSPPQTSGTEIDKRTKTEKNTYPPSTLPTTPMAEKAKYKRPGAATTFEILGIDRTTATSETVVSSEPLNGLADSALEPGEGLSGILPPTPRMRKSSGDGARKASSHSTQSSRIASGGPKMENSQPPTSLCTDCLVSLISAAVGPGVVGGNKGREVEAASTKIPKEPGVYTSDDGYHPSPVHPISRSEFKFRSAGCTQNLETDGSNRLSRVPPLAPMPAIAAGVNGYSIPQADWNLASQLQDQTEPTSIPSEPTYRPDPFGFCAGGPSNDVVRLAEYGRRIPRHQGVKDFLTSEAKIIRNRAVRVPRSGLRMNNNGEVDMTRLEEPGEQEEDMGTRKAKAVSRSWNRKDLVTYYALLVFLTSYYSLGSVHSVQVITEAVNDFTMRGEARYYQFELALSMLGVSRILGIIIFVKLTNTYSRPLALFIAVLVTIGGVAVAAFAVTWGIFGVGHALFHLGRSGALVVAQVIVADTSDLGWRGLFSWGLEMSLVAWIWTKPVVKMLVIEKLGWHVPIWIFFSFAFPSSIPSLTAAYVFHRRAKHWGFFPALQNVHWRSWWSLNGLWIRIQLFSYEFDSLGILLWTIGVGLLSTALSVSEKMQAVLGIWMIGLLAGGSLCIMFLVLWEVWLNNCLKATYNIRRQKARQGTTHSSGVSWDVPLGERTVITGPAGYDSLSVEQVATELSARIAELQDPGGHKSWGRRRGTHKEKCHPLFRARLLKRKTIPIGCLIGFLANFAMKIGFWSLWDRPEDLPIEYKLLVESLQGRPALANIEFTSFTAGGLFVSFLIRMTKLFKALVIVGLLLLLCGLLIFHYTDIYFIGEFQVIVSQAITGFGAGMIWISLLIGVQASCKKHSDVGMSIGLLTTSNALGEMTAEATKRFMQSYLMNFLPPETSQKYFLRALNGHWSIMLLIAIAATTFALVMAGVGLGGNNLDEVKQLVSGVVFGAGDAGRQMVYEEHPSWATPSPFIASPDEGNLPPRMPEPSPCGFCFGGTQTIAEGSTALALPQDQLRTNFPLVSETAAQVQDPQTATGYPTGSRGRGSTTGWETTHSESTVSESGTTSDSRTITSLAQVPDSYVDGIFTMDSDIEQAPRAVSPNSFESFEDRELAISPQIDTVICKGSSMMKQNISRSRITKGPHAAAGINMTGSGQQFSFKKRQIGATKVAPGSHENSDAGDKSSWSDSTSRGERVEGGNISEFLTNSDEEPSEIDKHHSVSLSPIRREVIGQGTNGEQQDFNSQLNSSSYYIAIRSGYIGGGDPGSGQVSPSQQVILMMSPDGDYPQQSLNSMVGGRISCSTYRTQEETALAPIKLSVTEVTSEAVALTENNSYSPEQCLSPIEELSSRGSMVNSITQPFDGPMGIGNLPLLGPPVVNIGLLSPSHRQVYPEPEKATSVRKSSAVISTPAKRQRKKGKEKASCGDSE